MTANKDYYSILGVPENADLQQIKKAYRTLAMKYHPDRASSDKKKDAEERFKEISEAYYILSDPTRRGEYDTYRKGYHQYSNTDFAQAHGFNFDEILKHFSEGRRDRSFSSKSNFSNGDFAVNDIFDLFNNMGNDLSGEYVYNSYDDIGKQQKEDTDIGVYIKIPENMFVKGGEVTFSHKGKRLNLKIKPGTMNGQKLRLKGQGKLCECCNHFGDLIVTVKKE